jgi:hypothetical protein
MVHQKGRKKLSLSKRICIAIKINTGYGYQTLIGLGVTPGEFPNRKINASRLFRGKRRVSQDCEYLPQTTETWIYLTLFRLRLCRLGLLKY